MSTATETATDPLAVWHGGNHAGEVVGGDGAVRVYRPAPDLPGVWGAACWPDHAPAPVLVTWRTAKGKRPRYVCQACGTTYGQPRCPHTIAATQARDLLDKERNH